MNDLAQAHILAMEYLRNGNESNIFNLGNGVGFTVKEDQKTYTEDYENDVETCLRTIKKISKLYDVSPVSIPANDATSISARKFSDGVIAEIEAERLERARKLKKLNLLMEV